MMRASLKNPRNIAIALGVLAAALGAVILGKALPPAKKPVPATATVVVVAKVSATPTVRPVASVTQTLMPASPTVEPPTPTLALPVATDTPSPTATSGATVTQLPSATLTPILPSPTSGATFTPYPQAPLCADHGVEHNTTRWHALWDPVQGCHYENEHGANPFAPEVQAVFAPLGDMRTLLGGGELSHTNPSSPAENVAKHGGHKWTVALGIPCEQFEGPANCVTDAAAQMHWFGDAAIEMEARRHSFALFVRACSTECGEMFVVQLVDLGQRVSCYQGEIVDYPDNPEPPYGPGFGAYFTIDSTGPGGCRTDRQQILSRNLNAAGIWTSKQTGQHTSFGSTLAGFLARVRDMYQVLNKADTTYPFDFDWLCSADGGNTYAPAGCRYTNSTGYVQEVAGVVPEAWDGLGGFDTDSEDNFITANAYVTQFGQLLANCIMPGLECHPVVLHHFPTGKYSGALPGAKVSNQTCTSNPSRNVWFANGVYVPGPCQELVPGAVPSGWIGPNN